MTPARKQILAYLAAQTEPVQRATICAALGIAEGSIAGALRPLIAASLVREVPRPHATRNYAPLVVITDEGRALLAPVTPPPVTLAMLGGIKHPPIPAPGTKPANMSAERWAHLTDEPKGSGRAA